MEIFLFGRVRDIVGQEKIALSVQTVGELLDALRANYPGLRNVSLLVAVNRDMVQNPDHPIHGTDEVAVFPPVGGG